MNNPLIEAAKNGDRAAIEALFENYQRKGFKLALDILKDEVDADDAFQEAFLKAICKLKTFKGDSAFETWLYRIIVRECLNILSKKRRFLPSLSNSTATEESGDYLVSESPALPDRLIERELSERINREIDTLPKQQRVIFILRFFNDLKLEEISEILKISVGSVKGSLFNAVKKMQEALKDIKNEY